MKMIKNNIKVAIPRRNSVPAPAIPTKPTSDWPNNKVIACAKDSLANSKAFGPGEFETRFFSRHVQRYGTNERLCWLTALRPDFLIFEALILWGTTCI